MSISSLLLASVPFVLAAVPPAGPWSRVVATPFPTLLFCRRMQLRECNHDTLSVHHEVLLKHLDSRDAEPVGFQDTHSLTLTLMMLPGV
mmetsp:Transcript_25694/g.78086  ORF Transcript_25694/g.78086 Transcript_25694/m.78086 type:complete len:89 (-) Transcript_25694:207-473(-)